MILKNSLLYDTESTIIFQQNCGKESWGKINYILIS